MSKIMYAIKSRTYDHYLISKSTYWYQRGSVDIDDAELWNTTSSAKGHITTCYNRNDNNKSKFDFVIIPVEVSKRELP